MVFYPKRTSILDYFSFCLALRGISVHEKFHAGVGERGTVHEWKTTKAVHLD